MIKKMTVWLSKDSELFTILTGEKVTRYEVLMTHVYLGVMFVAVLASSKLF